MRTLLQVFVLFFVSTLAFAQPPMRPLHSGEILNNLKKVNVLASALYIAAHPDDENTAMLSWLAKGRLARTAYLSCTRGDGGQNLIGPEQRELMGLIRTHELLQARSVDGPEQYFTRANDFGFSKTTEETMQFWGKDKVLADVVWRVRLLRPDVIICRFPPDTRAGHGNHSASAVLAEEAYKAAADPAMFPEQLKYVKPWQAKRVVWNTFNFGATSQKPADKGSFIQVNIGEYSPLLGKSYTEIAGESRSMHKSQGFGSAKNKGLRPEYLLHKDGTPAQKDIFDDIDMTWGRVKGGENVQKMIAQAIETFRSDAPDKIVPQLILAYKALSEVQDEYWKEQKKKEIEALILACAGVWAEANAKEYATAHGEKMNVVTQIVKRSDVAVKLDKISFSSVNQEATPNLALNNNEMQTNTTEIEILKTLAISQPYWLAEKADKGSYRVDDPLMRGLPLKPADIQATFTLSLENYTTQITVPVTYRWVDPVKGEIYRPLEVRPEVTATLAEKVYIFSDNKAKAIEVLLKASKDKVSGSLAAQVPQGWKVEPASIPFDLTTKYQEQKITFMVTPSASQSEGEISLVATTANGTMNKGLYTMDYEHIPNLVYFPDATAKVAKLDIKTKGKNIGYIAGAGDDVPAALRQIGFNVSLLDENALGKDLSAFDAIVVGVRAYNTEERLKFAQPKLMEFVANGGTMVVQYQTNFRSVIEQIGPYPFKIGRDRVTVEEAPITFLNGSHAMLNTPNKITNKDFDNWVQERGLYFASEWDSKYEALFACNDPNEKELKGSTLVAKHGKGTYIFTGLSFFRQLPAGVTGAYRLFANMISTK